MKRQEKWGIYHKNSTFVFCSQSKFKFWASSFVLYFYLKLLKMSNENKLLFYM